MTNARNKYATTFSFAMLFLFIVFFVLWCRHPHGRELGMFFARFNDLFADFFNVLRYVSERDPYFNLVNGYAQKEYLPLAYLILYPFSIFDRYAEMSLFACWNSHIGIYICFLFLSVCLITLLHSLLCLCKKYRVTEGVAFILLLSNAVLFVLERANIIILAAAFLNYFFSFYDAEQKYKRYCACVALATAATLKIFPVIFIFLYVPQKKYKELLITIMSGLLLTFLPFLFFKHGFGNIPQLYKNVKMANDLGFFNSSFGAILSNVVYIMQNSMNIAQNTWGGYL